MSRTATNESVSTSGHGHEEKTFRRRKVCTKPLTATSLSALRKDRETQSEIVQRLLATLDLVLEQKTDLEGRLRAHANRQDTTEADPQWNDGKDKTLVVLDWKGIVEVFADRWHVVKVLKLMPWDEREQVVEPLAVRYFGPWWENCLKEMDIVPQFNSPEEALESYVKLKAWGRLKELQERGELKAAIEEAARIRAAL